MMKRLLLLVLIVLVAALPLANVYAEDPAIGSKEDNACNAGGSLEGKCDTPWAWVCGWYLARYQAGIIPSVISACSSLIPPVPDAAAEAEGFVTLCIEANIAAHDLVIDAPLNTLDNAYYTVGNNNDCKDMFNIGWTVIVAGSQLGAEAIVDGLTGLVSASCTDLVAIGYIAPADWWLCHY